MTPSMQTEQHISLGESETRHNHNRNECDQGFPRFEEDWCSDSSVDSTDMKNMMSSLDSIHSKIDPSESTDALSESDDDEDEGDIRSRFAKAMEEDSPRKSATVRFDASLSLQIMEFEPPDVSCHPDLYYSCHQLQRMIDDARQRELDLAAIGMSS